MEHYMEQLQEEFAPMTKKEISKSITLVWKEVIDKSLEGEMVRIARPGFASVIGFIANGRKIKKIRQESIDYNKNRTALYKLIKKHK